MALCCAVECYEYQRAAKNLELKYGFTGSVTKAMKSWNEPLPPFETDHKLEIDETNNLLIYSAKKSGAFQVQGLSLNGKITRNGIQLKCLYRQVKQKLLIT